MEKNVLAVIAGREITEEDLNIFIHRLPKEQQMYATNPQFREHCKEQLIAMNVLAQCGVDEKLEETEEFQKLIADVKKDILAQLVLKNTLDAVTVSDEEAKEFFENNKQRYAKPATVSAKHILTDSEEKCNDILEKITSGEKEFEEAAKEFSTCPSGAQGGDLGEFGRGHMVKEFEEAAFAAEVGHVVGPVQTQFGYHLIKVEQKNDAKEADFEEVKEQIKAEALKQKQDKAYSDKVNDDDTERTIETLIMDFHNQKCGNAAIDMELQYSIEDHFGWTKIKCPGQNYKSKMVYKNKTWYNEACFDNSKDTKSPRIDLMVLNEDGIGFVELKVDNANCENLGNHIRHMNYILSHKDTFIQDAERRIGRC